MRALIFGGAGMLGGAMVREGRRRGAGALALASGQADVRDPARIAWACRAFRPDVIFNCAAFTRVDDCESEREHAFAVNATAVGHLARAADAAGAALVQVSTDYVFRGDADRPYREDDPTGPLSVYGQSKLAGEEEALAAERALVVRTSWLFGPLFGAGGGNFVRTIVRVIEGGERHLRVVDDQVGCPTYTPYLARALWDLAPEVVAGGLSGRLHYRNRGPVSWHGFARELARLWAPDCEVEAISTAEMPRPAPRPAYSVLDIEELEDALGRSVEAWSQGLGAYLALLRERGLDA